MATTPTSVSLSPETTKLLESLARDLGQSKTTVVEKALKRYHRELTLRQASDRFAELQQDPEAWAAIEAEREELDDGVADGLD